MKNKKENTNLYDIRKNNYFGLLFFAIVFASVLYIIKHETETFKGIEPVQNNIITTENQVTEITKENDEIKKLRDYLNEGDINIFKVYQSMYIYNDIVKIDEIDEETMLYMAYKYLERNNNFNENTQYITCEIAEQVNLKENIYQCGGSKYNASYYTVNSYITKENLKETVFKLFNRNIKNFTNFYTSDDNVCYFVNDNYICISHTTEKSNITISREFINAYKTSNKIEIIEKYKYIDSGIYYKGFNNKEVGEGTYKSTFIKENGDYHWYSTEYYNEN